MDLPVLPPVDPQRLAEHDEAHEHLARRLDSVDAEVLELFRLVQRRVLHESVANVDLVGGTRIIPPRRRLLAESGRRRLGGCGVAFRHIDSRSAMWRMGHVDDLVAPETVMVVHALAESHDPDDRETNPGLIRATDAAFDPTETDFVPPPGGAASSLVSAAIEMVNRAPAPGIARAAWICATLLAIHPFVDGNGRTARLLFHLVNGSTLPERVDWGSLEWWANHRRRYVDALQATQSPSGTAYRGRHVDIAPFMDFALDGSTRSTAVVGSRLDEIERQWTGPWDSVSPVARGIEIAVGADVRSTMDELAGVVQDPMLTTTVNQLVDAGRLIWDNGFVRLAPRHPLVT